jgi:hypothetical protein
MGGRSLALGLLLAALSCRTVPLPASFPEIDVPPGFTTQQVEIAIFSGILNTMPPPAYDPQRTMPQAEYEKFLWDYYLRTGQTRSWFPESRSPGQVIAAVNTRGHYLQVALNFDQQKIRTEFLKSQNLEQENGQIHKAVITWIGNLHEHIKRELGRMAVISRPMPKA